MFIPYTCSPVSPGLITSGLPCAHSLSSSHRQLRGLSPAWKLAPGLWKSSEYQCLLDWRQGPSVALPMPPPILAQATSSCLVPWPTAQDPDPQAPAHHWLLLPGPLAPAQGQPIPRFLPSPRFLPGPLAPAQAPS